MLRRQQQEQSAPPSIRPWQPTPEEEQDFASGDKTRDWLYSLSGGELRAYEGKWIAARDCRIAATASSEEELLRQISNDDIQRTIVTYVAPPSSKRVVHIYLTATK